MLSNKASSAPLGRSSSSRMGWNIQEFEEAVDEKFALSFMRCDSEAIDESAICTFLSSEYQGVESVRATLQVESQNSSTLTSLVNGIARFLGAPVDSSGSQEGGDSTKRGWVAVLGRYTWRIEACASFYFESPTGKLVKTSYAVRKTPSAALLAQLVDAWMEMEGARMSSKGPSKSTKARALVEETMPPASFLPAKDSPPPRHRLSMQVKLKYLSGMDVPDIEKDPRVHLTLSRTCSPTRITKNLARPPSQIEFSCVFETWKPYADRDSHLSLHFYTSVRSPEDDEWCGNQAGVTHIPLSEILESSSSSSSSSSSTFSSTRTLIVPAADGMEKGMIEIEISARGENGFRMSSRGAKILTSDARSSMTYEEADNLVKNYVTDCYNTFRCIEPSWNSIKDIHAYYYQSQGAYQLSGGKVTTGRLPASLYDLPKSSLSKESFYLNVLNCVLRRRGISTNDLLRSKVKAHTVGSILIECATVYPNYCKYITDIVQPSADFRSSRPRGPKPSNPLNFSGKNSKYVLIESFDSTRYKGAKEDRTAKEDDPQDASDCEDFTREILIFLWEVSSGRWSSEVLRRMKVASRLWVFMAVLGGVGGMKLDGHNDNAPLNAHEYCIGIPRKKFYEWILSGVESEKHLQRIASEKRVRFSNVRTSQSLFWEMANLVGAPDYISDPNFSASKDSAYAFLEGTDSVGILIGEGTGLLNPDPSRPDEKAREVISKGKEDVFENVRKMYSYYPGEENSFYRSCTTVFCPEFAYYNVPFVEFTFVYNPGKHPERPSATDPTAGVRFSDVTSLSSRISLLAQPMINETTRRACNKILPDQCPIPDLLPPTEASIREVESSNVSRMLASLPLPKNSDPSRYSQVVYFVRKGVATEKKARDIVACARSRGCYLEALPEVVTAHHVGGYYLRFYVPKTQVNKQPFAESKAKLQELDHRFVVV